MRIRYIANACFQITLSSGRTLLTDPWIEGPCQQTWFNFPPVPDALRAEVYGSKPDAIYISHLHHDHLHPQTLAHLDPRTPVIIGKLNTPNLKGAMTKLGFGNITEIPFETRTAVNALGCDVVLFRDFHGNTQGHETLVEYDLDTSIYLYDRGGATLFNAVDNTILPADAARIAAEYGAPDVAILPYASASLYPMAMAEYDDWQKASASQRIRERTASNFAANFAGLGAKYAVPAGGEYVLGGPVANLSQYLPQPLAADLTARLGGKAGSLRKLYPGDALDTATGVAIADPRATHRNFDDADRAAYAMTLADEAPSYTGIELPADLPFDWPRALKKCAGNYHKRREAMGLSPPIDIYLEVVSWPGREPQFLYKVAMDSDASGMAPAVATDDRARLTYTLDEKLLFALVTGLVSWNAIEASSLMQIRRSPDTYEHDLHRSIVHFSLLS